MEFLDESRTVFSHVEMNEPTSVLIFHDESTWDLPRLIRQVKKFGVDVEVVDIEFFGEQSAKIREFLRAFFQMSTGPWIFFGHRAYVSEHMLLEQLEKN